jgi:hypothetical protein
MKINIAHERDMYLSNLAYNDTTQTNIILELSYVYNPRSLTLVCLKSQLIFTTY